MNRNVADRYARETNADRLLLESVKFVLANIEHLHASWNGRTGDRGKAALHRKEGLIREVYRKLNEGEFLHNWERKVVDEGVELVHRGYGNESVAVHVDKKRKGLRFGKL